MNILSSEYFKELYRLKTYHEVIDEIYSCVEHVEPWMTGNCRGPSTAFCLLYKFFTMKLTVKQMHGLLKHPDSPYIRAVSFCDLHILFCEFLASWRHIYSLGLRLVHESRCLLGYCRTQLSNVFAIKRHGDDKVCKRVHSVPVCALELSVSCIFVMLQIQRLCGHGMSPI